jgi:hypothetical protein
MDGFMVNISGRPAVATGDRDMFIWRQYGATDGWLNQPIDVRLRFGSTAGLDYYIAVEDTLAPGFEVDRTSLDANIRGEVLSCSVRGEKVTFFINSLEGPMELDYRVIPTIPGSVVAPPARLFPMYSSSTAVFSSSAQLSVSGDNSTAAGESGGSGIVKVGGGKATLPGKTGSASKDAGKKATAAKAAQAALEDEEAFSPAAALPDFFIVGMETQSDLRAGESVLFVVTVGMAGFRSNIPMTVEISIDDREVTTAGSILPNSTEYFLVDAGWQAEPGAHLVTVRVDPGGGVAESDEANNFAQYTVYVPWPATEHRQSAAPWQVGVLALDAVLTFVVTLGLYRPVKRRMEGGKRTKGKGT